MECAAAREQISEHDGRVLRTRTLRAHLHACASCRDFRALLDTRRADLRMLAPPLPAATASALLAQVLAAQPSHVGPQRSSTSPANSA